jgi:hypothetical protein
MEEKPLPYVDEEFVDVVRMALADEAMREDRRVTLDLCECAAGVVAIPDRFFYDPKRWKLCRGGAKINTSAPIVEVQCKGLNDVSDIVAFAREQLVALKGDTWREDIFEEKPPSEKKK